MKKLILLSLVVLVVLSSCEIDRGGTYELTFPDGSVQVVSCSKTEIFGRDTGYGFTCDGNRYHVIKIIEVSDE